MKFQRRKQIGNPDGLGPFSDKNNMQDVLVEIWNVVV